MFAETYLAFTNYYQKPGKIREYIDISIQRSKNLLDLSNISHMRKDWKLHVEPYRLSRGMSPLLRKWHSLVIFQTYLFSIKPRWFFFSFRQSERNRNVLLSVSWCAWLIILIINPSGSLLLKYLSTTNCKVVILQWRHSISNYERLFQIASPGYQRTKI